MDTFSIQLCFFFPPSIYIHAFNRCFYPTLFKSHSRNIILSVGGRLDPHRPQVEHPLLAPLTPLPEATYFSQEVSHLGTNQAQHYLASVGNQSSAAG